MPLFRKKPSLLPLSDALAELEQLGIRRRDGVTLGEIEATMAEDGENPEDGVELRYLLVLLGNDPEADGERPLSDDIYYLDAECIRRTGDYAHIATRLQRLSRGALGMSGISDYVSIREGVAWLEFDFRGERVHWDIPFESDWLAPEFITKVVQHLDLAAPGGPRFLEGVLAQDLFIVYATNAQKLELERLVAIQWRWLK